MNTEYQWWLLAVFIAGAAGILWLLRGSLPRREVDVGETDRGEEAAWIASQLNDAGDDVPVAVIERALELHRAYLEAPPPPHDAAARAELAGEPAPVAVSSARRNEKPADDVSELEVPPARYRESRSGG